MKTTFGQMLLAAKQKKVAIAAFNFDNYEKLVAIIEASEETKKPVIAMLTESASKYLSIETAYGMFQALQVGTKQNQLLMFDHGIDKMKIKRAIDIGYDVVMIDHSLLEDWININDSNEVKAYAEKADKSIGVEIEIGHVGGKQDDVKTDVSENVTLERAVDFYLQTNPSALAIGVGTTHGIHIENPTLDIELIKNIYKQTEANLVLHGSSGVSREQVRLAIKAGITKVNYGTDLKIANALAYVDFFKQFPNEFDARIFGRYAIDAIKKIVIDRIKLVSFIDK